MNEANNKIGYTLSNARGAAGLSVEAVAERLRIDKAFIVALEKSDFAALPAPTFVRGYIRGYAQLLGCDAEALIEQYNGIAEEDPELVKTISVEREKSSGDPIVLWVSATVCLVLVILAGLWVSDRFNTSQLLSHQAAGSIAEATQNTDATTLESVAVLELDMPAANDLVAETDVFSTEPADNVEFESGVDVAVAESITPNAQAAAATAAVDANTESEPSAEQEAISAFEGAGSLPVLAAGDSMISSEAPIGDDRLQLQVNGESWVEVFDANGYRQMFGLFKSSQEAFVLQGQAPFQVILGDAQQVDIYINDERFDSAPFVQSNNTARLLVKAAN